MVLDHAIASIPVVHHCQQASERPELCVLLLTGTESWAHMLMGAGDWTKVLHCGNCVWDYG
jgi:hypothetical protein